MSAVTEVFRQSLWPFSAVYVAATWARNVMFDRGLRRIHGLPVPVVSIGNLTVGGTGKTPLVSWLIGLAQESGRCPGVLARGYGREAGDELNDEGMMLAARFPGLHQVQDPDRVRGGGRLVEEMGVDFVILDDGFQHRRLHRDVDIVCLDAEYPWSRGGYLPAGDLRESTSGLRRADLIVLTRADMISTDRRRRMLAIVRRVVGDSKPVFFAAHQPRDLVLMPSGEVAPVSELRDAKVLLLSAIARSSAFEATVEKLGAVVEGHIRRRDHHRHTADELAEAAARAGRMGAHLLVTEKDEAKLVGSSVERMVLRIDLSFMEESPTSKMLALA